MYIFLLKNRGTVTLMLSIILIPIMSLSSLMIEIGRAVSAKQALKEAENSSIMSLLAEFEKTLYDEYQILGTNLPDDKASEQFADYLKFNSDNTGDKANAFSSICNIKEASVKGVYNLSEPDVLQHSILEGGKYSSVYDLVNNRFLDLDGMVQDLIDNLLSKIGINNLLSSFSNAMDKIEKVMNMIDAVKKVKSKSENVKTKAESLGNAISSLSEQLNKKQEILNKYGGHEPQAPDSTKKDKTQAIKNLISKLYDEVGSDEDLDKSLPDGVEEYAKTLGLSTTYTVNNTVVVYSIGEFLQNQNMRSVLNNYGVKPNSIKTEKDLKKAKDNSEKIAKKAKGEFDKKNKQYSKDINELNSVNQAISNWLPDVAEKAKGVADSIGEYASAIKDAITSISELKGITKQTEESMGAKSSDSNSGMNNTEVKSNIAKLEAQVESISGQVKSVFNTMSQSVRNLANINSKDINAIRQAIVKDITGFNWGNIKNTITDFIFSKILSKEQLTEIIKTLDDANNWFQDLKNLLKLVQTMLDVLKPWPDLKDGDCNTTMSESNMSITLARYNATGQTNPFLLEDANRITPRIQAGNRIVSGIGGVNGLTGLSATTASGLTENEIGLIDTLIKIAGDISDILSSFKTVFFDDNGNLKSITAICKSFIDIKNKTKTLVSDLSQLFSGLTNMFTAILKKAYANVMLTEYIENHFLNRLSESDNPQDDTYQLFKKCEEEYVISGNASESTNQRNVALAIFMYRVIVNVVAVATDKTAMKVITSCNIFSPLVFIVWVYFESCIDINLIMYDCSMELLKDHLWISTESIKDLASKLDKVDMSKSPKEIVQEVFGADGDGLNFKYKDYMTFMLLFVSNKKKTQRIGDLVQWHVRTKNHSFLMKKTYTAYRAQAVATLNPILPIFNLSGKSGGLTNLTQIEQVWNESY